MSRAPEVTSRSFEPAIEAMRRALSRIPGVRNVVLFGSLARGQGREGSDMDLLVDCSPRAQAAVREAMWPIREKYGVWGTPVFVSYRDLGRSDRQFLESIVRDGRPLIGKLPPLTPGDLGLRPMRLVSYWAESLAPGPRAKLLRELDGYITHKRRGEVTYTSHREGLVDRSGGWRTGRGSIVVPEGTWPDLDEVFRRYEVKRTAVAIWSQSP